MLASSPQRDHCACEKPLVHPELGKEPLEKAIARDIRSDWSMVSSNFLPDPRGEAKGTANPSHPGPAWQFLSFGVINCYTGGTKTCNNNNN